MLVLARRLNERIVIPSIQAAIQVVGIQGGIVRLGFEAPTDVKVFREEGVRRQRPRQTLTILPRASAICTADWPTPHRNWPNCAANSTASCRRARQPPSSALIATWAN